MKISVVTGATLYESVKNIFSGIDKNDKSTPYFVVVPDRFTLQAEKILFEVLEIKSTFNINIVGLSSLAGKVIKENGYQEISSMEGALLVQKIFLENKEKFTYFKKSNSALCNEVYKTIQQMKSSNIKPCDIKEHAKSDNLKNKIKDIKLIYEKYEELRAGRIDREDVIEIFAKKIEEDKLYSGSVFVFAGFDSFTATNFGVISSLTKSVKELRFAVCKTLSPSNAFIYEGDILNKLKQLAEANNVPIEIISPTFEIEKNRKTLISNLFAQDIKKERADGYAFVTNSNSKQEEVLFVAKSIKKAVYGGARFRDFAIVCPSIEDYIDEFEVCFDRFGITKYIDTSKKFSSTILARFIKKCFTLSRKGFLKEDILYLLSSPLIEIENKEEQIAFVNEKHISGREKFNYFISKLSPVFIEILNLKEEDSFENYSQSIEKIAEYVSLNLDKHIEKEKELGFIQEASFDGQSLSALKEVVEAFKSIKSVMSLNDFVSMLLTALDSKEISALPSFCDQVFIGNSTDSFYSNVKYLFVLGANAGRLPESSNDNGLLTDGEIEGSCFNKILSPTIKMVNKRNRFKLFSALCQASERLTISYLNFNEDGQKQEKAYFVNNVMSMFDISPKEVIQTSSLSPNSIDTLLLISGTRDEAKVQLQNLIKNKNEFAGSLRKVLEYDEEEFSFNREKLSKDLAEKLLFPKGYAKVTQIEKYYDCPFKEFVENGLNPSQKQFAEIKPNTYGTIMHSVLEDFIKDNAKKLGEVEDEQIKNFIENGIEKYLDEKVVEFLPDKELFLKEIKDNAFKLCKRAVYEGKNTKFVPTYFEKRFDGRNLRVGGRDVVGCVDRVDICDGAFRVVDYKTGKITSSLLSSLYYGKKLQLFLYGNSLKKQLGLDFSGAFYFDAKISYSKNEKTVLKGVFKPTEKNIFALDKRIESGEIKQSDLVKIEKTKEGFSKATLSQPNLNDLEEYALKITQKALSQMKDGNISACPSAESCKYCEYRGICLVDSGAKEKEMKSADSFFKKKETYDEQI